MDMWLILALAAGLALFIYLNRYKAWLLLRVMNHPRSFEEWLKARLSKDDLGKFEESLLKKLSGSLAGELAKAIPESERMLAARVTVLQTKYDSLSKERWVTVGVRVHGFKMEGDPEDREYYAIVEVVPGTDFVRAPSKDYRWLIPHRTSAQFKPTYKEVGFTSLGAPWYSRVKDDPACIMMLDETYRVRNH